MTIQQIQNLLQYLGYYTEDSKGKPLVPDGRPGPGTRKAVEKFQQAYGIDADGQPGPITQKALKDAVAHGMPVIDDKDEGTAYPIPPSDWPFRYFSQSEFACQCGCGLDNISHELVAVAEDIRRKHGKIIVTSGLRCERHNREVGGVPNSRHIIGHAMDFYIVGKTSQETLAIARSYAPTIKYAYAINERCVHMDIGR